MAQKPSKIRSRKLLKIKGRFVGIGLEQKHTTGAKWQISTEGGEEVVWASSGEIFYLNGTNMMAVDITTEPAFTSGTPKVLFEGSYDLDGPRAAYDVTPDGQKSLMIKTGGQQVSELNVVQNWFEELKRLVPTN